MQDEGRPTQAQAQEARQKLFHYAAMHGAQILQLTSEEASKIARDYHAQAGAPEHSPRERCDLSCKYVQYEAIAAALGVLEQVARQAPITA